MQVPILNGIYTSEASDFRVAYPYNLVPVPVDLGLSIGYLKPGEGIVPFTADGPGVDRGGINWNGSCYRVMGTRLVRIAVDGTIFEIGTIDGTDQVSFDYSFDKLAVSGNGKLYLYDGITLTQITDPDLGIVVDFIWVDGYFMTTDGEFIAVTELANPFSVLPTKYGSSESDPDQIVALLKLHNEPIAINRYTMETFSNIGGTGFPFTRVDGALIDKGAVGTHACCLFMDNIAIVGGGRNEVTSVYLGSNGQMVRIATREIDLILADYTDSTLVDIKMESRVSKGHQLLYIHLPNKTLVYDGAASQVAGQPTWFILGSGIDQAQYRAHNFVYAYNQWLVGNPEDTKIGKMTTDVATHWGVKVGWEFSTIMVYNEGMGCIFHELELVSLTGRVDLSTNPMISTCYSVDGEVWSQRKYILAGKTGERQKRLVWLQQGSMRQWRVQKFNGDSDSRLSIARLEARIEPLVV
jgi:hypothetical protein